MEKNPVSFETLYAEVETKVTELNIASAQDNLREADVSSAKELVKGLNKVYRADQFVELKKQEKPLETAIRQLDYKQYKLTQTKDKDTDISTFTLDEVTRRINLLDFISFCAPATIVADPIGVTKLANFAMLLSARKLLDLGGKQEELNALLSTYRMVKGAKRNEVKDRDKILTSNKTMESELQALVDAFIPGLKVVKEDVMFMVDVFTSQGKENLSVRLGDPRKMADIIIQVMHKLLTGKQYSVEYKAAKTK